MSKDIYNRNLYELSQVPATKTTSFNSGAIDSQNLQGLAFLVLYGATGDTLSTNVKVGVKIQKSITSNFSVAVDCDAAEIISSAGALSSNSIANIDDNAEDATVYGCGVKIDPNYRYYRAAVTFTGSHTYGIPMAILAIKEPIVIPDTTNNLSNPA